MNLKKIEMVLVLIVCIFIVPLGIYLFQFYTWKNYDGCTGASIMVSNGHYKVENYKAYGNSYIGLYKYYYSEDNDVLFINNDSYKLVDGNEEIIKKHINSFLDKLYKKDNSINVDFNYDIITSNDYYYMAPTTAKGNGKCNVFYYYDMEEHVLYVTE